MILIFKASDNSFHLASGRLNKAYDTDEYNSVEVETFDPEYTYTYSDGAAVKGSKIVVTSEEKALYAAHKIATSHVTPRMLAYAEIGIQLDKLWHDIDSGTLDKTGSFYTSIKAVKDATPKE